MKIIVLHGEDIGKSFDRLKKFKETAQLRSWEVVNMSESSQSFQEILSESSLFSTERFFIHTDIKKITKKEFEWLDKRYKDLSGNLILYSETTLSPTFFKMLPKDVRIEEFKLPKLIWAFLEHIYPGNSERAVKELHQIIEREPIEFVFSLICKQFKEMYWVIVDPKSPQIPGWKAAKLRAQALKFKPDQLNKIINLLSDIDYSVKTGRANLLPELDLMMIKQLE